MTNPDAPEKEKGKVDPEVPDAGRPLRKRKFQAVDDIGATDLSALSKLPNGPVRDIINYNVTALVQDIRTKDPVWLALVKKAGLDDTAERYFSGGHPISPPVPSGPYGGTWDGDQKKVSALLKSNMLGPGGKGARPADGSTAEGVFQSGPNQPGIWKPDGSDSYLQGPRNYSAEYDISLASAISQTLINRLQADNQKVTEIQAMILDDRMLVSANEAAAVSALITKELRGLVDNPPAGLAEWAKARQLNLKDLTDAIRGNPNASGIEQLTHLGTAANFHPDQAGAISAVISLFQTDQYLIDGGADASAYVTGSAGKGKVILIQSAGFCHAEQNLLVALVKANYGGRTITVAGGKRPCAACHVALEIARTKYPQLRYLGDHGGGWYGSSKQSFSRLAAALNLSLADIALVAARVLPQAQYATAFGDDAPEQEKITNLRDRVYRDKVATDRLPAPGKRPPEIVADLAEFVPDAETMKEEDQEELDYEINAEDELPPSQEFVDVPVPPVDWVDPGLSDVEEDDSEGSGSESD